MSIVENTRNFIPILPQVFLENVNAGCVLFGGTDCLFDPEQQFLRDFLISLVRNPDPDSKFAKAAEQLIDVPDEKVLEILISQGYCALVYFTANREIFGHAAFQIHDDTIKMFSVGIAPHAREQGCGRVILLDLVEWGKNQPNLKNIILGEGGDEKVQKICEYIAGYEEQIGVKRTGGSSFRYIEDLSI